MNAMDIIMAADEIHMGLGTSMFLHNPWALVSGNDKMKRLVEAVKKLNDEIIADASLGKGFVIGHSFFCGRLSPEEIVRYEIGPTLDEYWFDNQSKADEERNKLLNAIR